jgi:replicative DNA helicase
MAMGPGSRKSSAYKDMIEPLEAYESDLQARMAPEIARAKEARAIEEGRLRALRERAVKAKTPTERELAQQEAVLLAGRLTAVPAEPRLLAGDVTPEKLANLLCE